MLARTLLCTASLFLFAGCPADDADESAESRTASSGGSSGDTTTTTTTTTTTGTTTAPATTGETTGSSSSSGASTGVETMEVTITTEGSTTEASTSEGTTMAGPPQVVVETTLGTFVIELYPDDSPITVANFLAYVEAGFFDGTDGLEPTIFHRVIPGFVIQGGGLTAALAGKPTMPAIVNEHSNGLTNDRGTLSVARTNNPDSATSQFFVNVVDNPNLDTGDGYAVFGTVIDGMDVVDAIVAVPTETVGQFEGVPVDPITMTSVYMQ